VGDAESATRMQGRPQCHVEERELQVVSLSECGTHAQVAAAMGPCRAGERELAARLTGPVDEDMLITADSGFYSWQLWDLYAATGAALCWRVGAAVTLPLARRLPDGPYLALIFAPGATVRHKATLLAAARGGDTAPAFPPRLIMVHGAAAAVVLVLTVLTAVAASHG